MPFDKAREALEEISPHVVRGPEHHADDDWDLTFLKADFGGQRVELGDFSGDPKFLDRETGRWVAQRIDYAAGVRVELLGVRAWVMPEAELVRYKLLPGREVALEDVGEILGRHGPGDWRFGSRSFDPCGMSGPAPRPGRPFRRAPRVSRGTGRAYNSGSEGPGPKG